jgi:phosphoserine phosphatase RsbU/P
MKNKKTSFRLNVIHISMLLILVVSLSVINFFAVKKLLFKELKKNITISCTQIYEQIVATRRGIETSAKNYTLFLQHPFDKKEVANFLTTSLPNNFSINTFCIYSSIEKKKYTQTYFYSINNETAEENNDRINKFLEQDKNELWVNIPDPATKEFKIFYYYKIDDKTILEINYNLSRIEASFHNINIDKGGFPVIFNQSGNIIYAPLASSENTKLNLKYPSKIKKTINHSELEKEKGVTLKGTYPYNNKEKHLTYVAFEPIFGWYITINQPYSEVYSDLFLYFKILGTCFFLVFIFLMMLLIFANNRQIRPYSETLEMLRNMPGVSEHLQDYENEALALRVGVEILQNQLEQYINGLEKNLTDRSKFERDLQLAKKLQRNVLPTDKIKLPGPQTFCIHAISEPAFDIGGDLYDYFMLDEDRLAIAVGDVAGKGIPASLFMIFTHTLLREVAKPDKTVDQIVSDLNKKLIEENFSDLFVTFFMGILNIRNGEFTYCNAAHCFPFLIKRHGELIELNETHGIPIGIYADREYNSSKIALNANDMIFIYTDGVIDSKDENGMKYSDDVLKFNLIGSWFSDCESVVLKIKESVDNFHGNVSPEDDLTLLALKYFGNGDGPSLIKS